MKTLMILVLATAGGCNSVFICAPQGTELHVIPPMPPVTNLILPMPEPDMFDNSRAPEGWQARK